MLSYRDRALLEDHRIATIASSRTPMQARILWLEGKERRKSMNITAKVSKPPREPVLTTVNGTRIRVRRQAVRKISDLELLRSTIRQDGRPISSVMAK
jgi:hypothetical protein